MPLVRFTSSAAPVGIHSLPGKQPSLGLRNSRQKFRFWYDNVIDWMLANPGRSITECAKAVNRAPSTLYIVSNSDLFRTRFAQRRAEINSQMADEISDAVTGVALSGMRELQKRITENAAKIPPGLLNEVATTALTRLGYGVPALNSPMANTQVNVNMQIAPDVLREAQEKMRSLQTNNTQIITIDPPIPSLT